MVKPGVQCILINFNCFDMLYSLLIISDLSGELYILPEIIHIFSEIMHIFREAMHIFQEIVHISKNHAYFQEVMHMFPVSLYIYII